MLQAYIDERYGPNSYDAAAWRDMLEESNIIIKEFKDKGFTVYALNGDALIIYDMYVLPSARGQKNAWFMHNELTKEAKQMGKNICISFSENNGINQHLGRAALAAASFKKAYELEDVAVYLKGI